MSRARLRLILAAVLFSGWLGWLAFLAFTSGTIPGPPGVRKPPVILSRPQFLESTLDVVARVEETDGQPDPHVKVLQVLWPKAREDQAGKVLTVTNLGASKGWSGPGEYLLPLEASDPKTYQVAMIPRYPGLDPREQRPHIYPNNAETMAQYGEIHKPPLKERHADK
jgi:hypothetical protein